MSNQIGIIAASLIVAVPIIQSEIMKSVVRVTINVLRRRNAVSDLCRTSGAFGTSFDHEQPSKTRSFLTSSAPSQSQPQSEEEVLNLPPKPIVFRTTKTNPATFDENDVGLFYTLSPDRFKQLFQWGMEQRFRNQIKAVNEAAFMIRRPFMEIRDLMSATEATHMSRRILLRGKRGAGKSMTLNSLIHYGSTEG